MVLEASTDALMQETRVLVLLYSFCYKGISGVGTAPPPLINQGHTGRSSFAKASNTSGS